MIPLRLLPSALALALASSAVGQTVLDDYATDRFPADYIQKSVPGFGPGGWNVAAGELRPDSVTSAGGYAAFVWTGHSLQQTGDWFSIDLFVASAAGDQNAGLSIWTSTDGASFDRVVEPRLGYNGNYAFIGSDADGPLWADNISASSINDGFVTLRVTVVSQNEAGTELEFDLAHEQGSVTPVQRYTVAGHAGPLFVGPSAWQATGANIAFDNLTYFSAAIPEPSAAAALFGGFTFAVAAARRRNRGGR